MMIFYRFVVTSAILMFPLFSIAQTDCPNFKNARKGSQSSKGGGLTQMKASVDGLVLVSPTPIDYLPMILLGGETSFLRHFTVGYNMGFTVKRNNRNSESGRFEGLLLRPELRYYFTKSFSGVWVGGQTNMFIQDLGFQEGLAGVQLGKSTFQGKHTVVNYFISWAQAQKFNTVGIGVSWGYLWK